MIDLFKIIERMKTLEGFSSEKQIAETLGLSAPDFSRRKKSGVGTLFVLISEWAINHNVNLNWLAFGAGSPYIIGDKKEGGASDHQVDMDPEKTQLLKMTGEVLDSDTEYSASLAANIRSFHTAVRTSMGMTFYLDKIANLEKRVSQMEKDRGGHGACCIEPHADPHIKEENSEKKAM